MRTATLVPVKAFGAAKGRLRGHLPDADRERLARWTADQVLTAALPYPVFVACDDESVADWATRRGASVAWGPGLGLNGAIDAAVAEIAAAGFDRVTITHADLPTPRGLAHLHHATPRPASGVVIVPDRHGDGTNVLSRPTAITLPAQYGPGSFGRHLAAALATGAPVTVRHDPFLSVDIDTPADLRHPTVARLLATALGATT
ncbi:MAG TPA: 2-phospho-L-lactate guanylyltransferase [Ilumatobacter sp.]|nr:2-phospho-L-lactate guanylyltransferase [Ilumatobacter sp.]